MDRCDDALINFNLVIELGPEDRRADRGHSYWLMARYDEALADVNLAIALWVRCRRDRRQTKLLEGQFSNWP